jgi:hypothetical protein
MYGSSGAQGTHGENLNLIIFLRILGQKRQEASRRPSPAQNQRQDGHQRQDGLKR